MNTENSNSSSDENNRSEKIILLEKSNLTKEYNQKFERLKESRNEKDIGDYFSEYCNLILEHLKKDSLLRNELRIVRKQN